MVPNKILILLLVALAVGVVLYVLIAPLLAQSARANERRLAIVRGEVRKNTASRDTEAAARRKQRPHHAHVPTHLIISPP